MISLPFGALWYLAYWAEQSPVVSLPLLGLVIGGVVVWRRRRRRPRRVETLEVCPACGIRAVANTRVGEYWLIFCALCEKAYRVIPAPGRAAEASPSPATE